MKVVFGGAFNPITKAHLKVYEYIKNNLDISEFIFLPVSNAYTKSSLASNYHRLEMLKLALENEPVTICEMELDDPKFLGTYQSLIRLYDQNNEKIAFVIGADNLPLMKDWINIEGILSEFKIIVLGRDGIDIEQAIKEDPLLKKHESSFIIFKAFKMEISSTLYRESFNKSYVEPNVHDYVETHGLYRGEEDV